MREASFTRRLTANDRYKIFRKTEIENRVKFDEF